MKPVYGVEAKRGQYMAAEGGSDTRVTTDRVPFAWATESIRDAAAVRREAEGLGFKNARVVEFVGGEGHTLDR